jgi:hypothetical protein
MMGMAGGRVDSRTMPRGALGGALLGPGMRQRGCPPRYGARLCCHFMD